MDRGATVAADTGRSAGIMASRMRDGEKERLLMTPMTFVWIVLLSVMSLA